jgi:hypothetical protein
MWRSIFLFLLLFLQMSAAHNKSENDDDTAAKLSAVLDSLHDAAAKADFRRYFDCFAPDAVFLGTDATERWTVEEFKAFCKPYFDKGQGWTYTPRKNARHITISPDGSFAWFDELLDNAKYGECRGTGVLRKVQSEGGNSGLWKIAQYSLSIPIPNARAGDVIVLIRAQQSAASRPGAPE